jgi:hypothetical protein
MKRPYKEITHAGMVLDSLEQTPINRNRFPVNRGRFPINRDKISEHSY